MQLAQACALSFAMRHRVHFDEAVAEANYLLVLHVLRYTTRFVDSKFDYERNLRSHITKRLWDYFKKNKLVCVSDMLGQNWSEKYGHSLGVVDPTVTWRDLIEGITDNNVDLSVLILLAEGYTNPQIEETLGLSIETIVRSVNKIRSRLGDTAESSCRHSYRTRNLGNPPNVLMTDDWESNVSNVSNYLKSY